jgi:peptide/nickel transport system substrate-binding protein
MTSSGTLRHLVDQLTSGALDRRQFMTRATALGVGVAGAAALANGALAQDATPDASPEASAASIPSAGTDTQERGAGGELRIIQSQAPTVLAAHSSTGSKDNYAASLTSEPLFIYLEDGSLYPLLAAEVPTVENGQISEDLTTATISLREGVTWSDGTPFTANDVVFTWQWITNPDNGSVNIETWSAISKLEAVDDLTAKATFAAPQLAWFDIFTGVDQGIIYPAHAFNNDPANKNDAFLSAPIGTGPFKVDSFAPNDAVQFSMNENYREPTKPFFSSVSFKGGGDAVSAGRAVVQTGDFDYAWNVQAEPEVIQQLQESGEQGTILQKVDTTVESIYLNFSDPNKEVDGQRSQKDTPHPFFADKAVRKALNVAINRGMISGQFYGDDTLAESNVLAGNPFFESPNTSWEFNLDTANQILDEAGWTKDGDTRAKDGVRLELTYASPINSVRQKQQQVIKADLERIGFKVTLAQIDTGVFFDSAAGNDQNFQHFYFDITNVSSGATGSVPITWLNKWYAGPDGENIAQKENGWAKNNNQRWQNADFDAMYEELQAATDLETAQQLLIALNDLVIEEVVAIPIVWRPFFNAVSNRLRVENIGNENGFGSPYWNIANWNLADGA